MLFGEVKPTSMMRSPGSACSRLRMAAQPPEWRGTRGPEVPCDVDVDVPLCFLSNQFRNLISSCDRACQRVRPARSCRQATPPAGAGVAASGALAAAPCVRSTFPRKTALSSTERRRALISPSTAQPARSSTRPLATTLPCTRPMINTSFAVRSAATCALGPTVNRLSERLTVPSTCPSTIKSSLPFTSPRITTLLPMRAGEFSTAMSLPFHWPRRPCPHYNSYPAFSALNIASGGVRWRLIGRVSPSSIRKTTMPAEHFAAYRLIAALWILSGAAMLAQPAPDALPPVQAQALVERALANELRAAQDGAHPMRYVLHKASPRLTSTKEMIETKDGAVARLVAINDQPLNAANEQKEQARLDALLRDPGQQRHRKQAQDADFARAIKVLRVLPSAFLYEYAGPE